MLLRRSRPDIEIRPLTPIAGLEHLKPEPVAVLRWLSESRVEHVLVGQLARTIRSEHDETGPVAIAPAPYGRNLERLAKALTAAHARLRSAPAGNENTAVKITAEKLARPQRWELRCGSHDLDIEGGAASLPSYEELIYEAGVFELEPGLKVQVASIEDVGRYAHLQRVDREIRVTRLQTTPTGAGALTGGDEQP
ncbi:MAG TPA: hypothetical protein VMD48_02220 [Solirubrobacteraceae bacterium]|nr:hypothetical protein [Solirubrobacteraceae bacterium]